MKSIKIAGKKFALGSRLARLYAFFIDITCLLVIQIIAVGIMRLVAEAISPSMWGNPQGALEGSIIGTFGFLSVALWVFGLFFIDGFRNGQGIGKKLLSLQVLRLKDGKTCNFKDAFVRRFSGVFQPLDFLWSLGSKRQRLGDKFAETAVVKLDDEVETPGSEIEDPEAVLESVIVAMKSKLSEARQKVDASIGVEKEFKDAYEGAVVQAERSQERAVINLKAGREDLAREDLEKRNEYRLLAEQYKSRWEEQKQVVQALSDLLEHLQQKMIEAEGKKIVVVAQHRNVDAEAHLREMLKEIQDSKAFETLVKMEQDTTEAATLAKAAAEMDVTYQAAKSEREFASYAEEASLDKDFTELKTKLR